MFNWPRTPVTCPSWLGRLSAIDSIACALLISFLVFIPKFVLADAAVDEADAVVLDLAFRGYVAIVFPVEPGVACSVHASNVERKYNDTYRSWYRITVNASCPKQEPEKYDIWFMCSRRNSTTCILIVDPNLPGAAPNQ